MVGSRPAAPETSSRPAPSQTSASRCARSSGEPLAARDDMPTPSDDASLTLSPTWFAAIFGTIWKNAVRRRYEMGVINSERALQACIVEALSPLAPEIVALVEPRVVIGAGNLKPDLWIGNINSKRALAIVEIKYVP